MQVKHNQQIVNRELLGLFQGELTLEIPEGGETHTEFPLMKNTNKIRFVLIDTNSGTALDAADFDVSVTTTNSDLSHDNQPVSDTRFIWRPYYQGGARGCFCQQHNYLFCRLR